MAKVFSVDIRTESTTHLYIRADSGEQALDAAYAWMKTPEGRAYIQDRARELANIEFYNVLLESHALDLRDHWPEDMVTMDVSRKEETA